MTLTRTQFQQACQAFIRKYDETEHSVNEFTTRCKQGWRWHQHSIVPGLGYMAREGYVSRRKPIAHSDSLSGELHMEVLEEEDDDSTLRPQLQAPYCETLIAQHHIVYSPTFQVPAFYFTVHDTNGSPLPLCDIIGTSLFRPYVFPQSVDAASHGISMHDSNFPLLSQGEHPVLGTPCWYFHPCETSVAVTELLEAGDEGEIAQDNKLLRWMEAWFLVITSVVDIR